MNLELVCLVWKRQAFVANAVSGFDGIHPFRKAISLTLIT